MKCYTFYRGVLHEGISVVEDERLGCVVYLGEEGRGRWCEKVGFFYKNPPEVKNGHIYEAYPFKITINRNTKKEKSFYVLAKPNNSYDQRVLVRINTKWVYTRDTIGSWRSVRGKAKKIASGYGARGIAGRIGSWEDSIIVMSPGDIIRIRPEGGYKTKPYILIYDKKIKCIKLEDYECN